MGSGLLSLVLGFDSAMPVAAHEKMKLRQRQYCFVGGMPEAVLAGAMLANGAGKKYSRFSSATIAANSFSFDLVIMLLV